MKPIKNDNQRVAQDWIVHARSDLRYAKRGLDDRFILGAHVCFHAQQAAEKAVKALLLAHGRDFPFTHDIETLIHLLKHYHIPIPSCVLRAGSLTPYAAELRYPGDMDEDITQDEVRKAVRLAEQVVHWIKKAIEQGKKKMI
ncbi:MAG: HEPN domain-containing protein [Kiritimatiellae bacterium]|nr:HEPN domain-containing protein [Verrucomicrobiota bacterium]MBU4366897.1 HEPN domain-containing protein [Verrucomicrobiota bacterium]MCG2658824.1 HEPN domain-containing protein [Kiritimatiellia bacterium]